MKNKWKQCITKGMCILLSGVMMMGCLKNSNLGAQTAVHAQEGLSGEAEGWDGVTREKTWESDSCRISCIFFGAAGSYRPLERAID